jgi:hypothetical protein
MNLHHHVGMTEINPIPWNDEAGAAGLRCYDEDDQWKINSSFKMKKQIVDCLLICRQLVKAKKQVVDCLVIMIDIPLNLRAYCHEY